jgi:hypothetical protein
VRLEVPLFQRQYVWSREHQWAPLWEDICRKVSEYLEGRKDAPAHFLGAMVLDQKQTPTTHVERRLIIDGQQRLTTFQIFLAALRDFCTENACDELAKEFRSFVTNKGMMADPSVDRFKVWPTQLDRQQFRDVLEAGSRAQLESKYPLIKRKYARRPEPRPRMVEAYMYFHDQIADFSNGTENEKALNSDADLADRLEECLQALKNSLLIVVIDLTNDDDAQVIFETLNVRGEPLLPADLLRNYIFLRASRQGESQEDLYDKFWSRFDDPFWRKEVRQGRLSRPRSDLFIQHLLASRLTVEIPIRHLFVEYKYWIERNQPFKTVRDELEMLAAQGDAFRRLMDPQPDDPVYSLANFLMDFEIGMAHPLLLMLLDTDLTSEQWTRISTTLESYLLRRAICDLPTKNYNRVFLSITKQLREAGPSPETLEAALTAYTGESTEWPKDRAFRSAWKHSDTYRRLGGARCIHVPKRLNWTYFDKKMEQVRIESALSVEHLMPQSWPDYWPLPMEGRVSRRLSLFPARTRN